VLGFERTSPTLDLAIVVSALAVAAVDALTPLTLPCARG
jgi:hypothetical protein